MSPNSPVPAPRIRPMIVKADQTETAKRGKRAIALLQSLNVHRDKGSDL